MKREFTPGKLAYMKKVSTTDGIISALAIDQRGALKKMMKASGMEATQELLEEFKVVVSQELTKYASSILLDPEYGLPAAAVRDSQSGVLLAYEQTGYDTTQVGRLPDLLPDWSAKRIKEAKADAVKFLLYYDIDESADINDQKHAFVERIGSECVAEDIPFFLEVLSYDGTGLENNSEAYAKVKPHKVNDMMKEFSKPRYNVDVLKVEVPVNMNFVEGFGEKSVYTQKEAASHFAAQSTATDLPFIFLSAGVTAELFQQTLIFAKEAGSTFNGVLCGRATWANGVASYVEGGKSGAIAWMQDQGRKNIEELNAVIAKTATPW